MDAGADVISMTHIAKRFDDLVAVHDASLSVRAGEIHALVGENGAGKTTLMNILYGLLPRDGGDIRLRGESVASPGLREAIAAGIGMVHQHFKLAPSFTVAENIILGAEPLTSLRPHRPRRGRARDGRTRPPLRPRSRPARRSSARFPSGFASASRS